MQIRPFQSTAVDDNVSLGKRLELDDPGPKK